MNKVRLAAFLFATFAVAVIAPVGASARVHLVSRTAKTAVFPVRHSKKTFQGLKRGVKETAKFMF